MNGETGVPNVLRSIVLLPGADPATAHRWMMICAEYCAARRYEVFAVVSVWADAWQLIHQGRASVLVVGSRDHLPPEFEPRVEVVAEQTTTPVSSARRRPKRRTVRRQVP